MQMARKMQWGSGKNKILKWRVAQREFQLIGAKTKYSKFEHAKNYFSPYRFKNAFSFSFNFS